MPCTDAISLYHDHLTLKHNSNSTAPAGFLACSPVLSCNDIITHSPAGSDKGCHDTTNRLCWQRLLCVGVYPLSLAFRADEIGLSDSLDIKVK